MGQVKINDPGNVGTFKCQEVKGEARKNRGSQVLERDSGFFCVLTWNLALVV